MPTKEVTTNVTEFKAKCLEHLRKLETGKLTRVTVTRRGKPVAVIERPQAAKKIGSLEEMFADMRGLITVAPGVDLTEPLNIPEPADPFIGTKASNGAA